MAKINFSGKIISQKRYIKINKSDKQFLYDQAINSLIVGDNLASLFKLIDNFGDKIDLIYIDPPFATGNDFFSTKTSGSSISTSKEAKAYSDKLTGDAFLLFLQERLILLKELLSERGTIYIHIGIEMSPYVRLIMDEIFGRENFMSEIARVKSNPKNFERKAFGNNHDTIIAYSKKPKGNIFNNIRVPFQKGDLQSRFNKFDGKRNDWYTTVPVHAPGESSKSSLTGGKWNGNYPPIGRHWRKAPEKLDELNMEGKIEFSRTGNPRIKIYLKDSKGRLVQDFWSDFKDPQKADYPTQKNLKMIEMIIQESSLPGSIVLDAFAGSGQTLFASQKLKRNFIGMDQSKEAIEVIKKRMPGIKIVKNK